MDILGVVPVSHVLTSIGPEPTKTVNINKTGSEIREVMEVTLYDASGRAYNYIISDLMLNELV